MSSEESDMMDDAEEMDGLSSEDFLLPHEQEMRAAIQQVIAAMQAQNELLLVIARRLGPKRVVRDPQTGKVVGAEPIE